jgi:hypothetical protein
VVGEKRFNHNFFVNNSFDNLTHLCDSIRSILKSLTFTDVLNKIKISKVD